MGFYGQFFRIFEIIFLPFCFYIDLVHGVETILGI